MARNVTATRTSIGRQFYSWSSLGSFAGSVSAVTIVRQVAQSLELEAASNNWFSLVVSLIVVIIIAFATEPFGSDDGVTAKVNIFQKTVQTLFNSLLVYSAVIGLPAATSVAS